MFFNVKIVTRQLAEAGVDFQALLNLSEMKDNKYVGKDYMELGFERGRTAGKMVDLGLLKKIGYKPVPRITKTKASKVRDITLYGPGVHFESWKKYYLNIIAISASSNQAQGQTARA